MLCYRCGSHVPDNVETCPACGQKLSGSGLRQATGTFSRRRATTSNIEGAPYKVQDLVANRYLVKDIIGQGPLGHVFRAHDKEIDVEVALKVINPRLVQTPDERKQFSKVMRTARKLSHPNLVRVYEEGEDADRPYFTSQFLDGLTLRKIIDLRLQKGQFFALHEIEPILAQVCAALDGAHKVGPHTDLKPDNVLVLPDLLKVTDFGLGSAMPRPPFVQAMKARKADRYLAPELIDGNEVDLRCDVYSVGVILGEMLSGLTPDGALPELSRRNPEVPMAVEGMYRKALNSNPNARFKTAEEFINEFIELIRKATPAVVAVKPESAMGGPPPMRPRTATGMLQLQPRKAGMTPELPLALPPPPPPVSGEQLLPDATQPVDPDMLKIALEKPLKNGHLNFDRKGENRQETEIIDSGQFVATIDADDNAQTKAALEPVVSDESEKPNRTWLYVLLLVVFGVGLGAGGGLYMIEHQKAATEERQRQDAEEKVRREAEQAQKLRDDEVRAQAEIASKAAAVAPKVALTPVEKVAAEKAEVDKQARAAAASSAERAKATATVVPPVAAKMGESGCPQDMRLVGSGPFKMGTSRDDSMMGFDEKPLAVVEVPSYCIDAYEFPNKRGVGPMVAIAWADAKRQCESQNKRLCSETEWEKACKGPGGGTRWPYGNAFDPNVCNTEDDTGESRAMVPAGRFTKCRSGYGVADLSGNASEWTAEKMIKGGSYASSDYAVRCSARKNGAAFAKSSEVSFRCCADPK